MQRREFFSSFSSLLEKNKEEASKGVVYPPYNEDISLFTDECKNCDAKCASACEENIIFIAKDATPYLLFNTSGCTFCDACAEVCEFDVLKVENRHYIQADISISQSACLAWNDTMCFSCKEPCLDNAIIFDGLFKPIIDKDKCTSCGFCISRCPTNAIELTIIRKKNEHI